MSLQTEIARKPIWLRVSNSRMVLPWSSAMQMLLVKQNWRCNYRAASLGTFRFTYRSSKDRAIDSLYHSVRKRLLPFFKRVQGRYYLIMLIA